MKTLFEIIETRFLKKGGKISFSQRRMECVELYGLVKKILHTLVFVQGNQISRAERPLYIY